MATWRRILGVLRRSPDTGDPLPDGELLARFAASRDQAAFELLVWRHAAMVFGVCRRALRDEHLAEDAFQAVFLVLARKAGAVRSANVAGWLFRVARRVSVRAATRLRVTQPIAVEPIAPALPDRVEQDELRALLDAEIARLPERFRLPVLLCYLGGMSTEDAARQLGVPRGTILSRLATARKRLAGRLTRRGVTIPAVVVATPNLVHSTVSAAAAFAARLPHLATRAALVAEGVLRTMTITKLVPVAALLVVTGLVSGYGLRPGQAEAPTAALQPEKAAAKATVPPQPAEQKARDDEYRRLRDVLAKLQDEIDREERNIRAAAELNNFHDPRRAARIDRQLALLEAELFATEREVAELNARRDLLREKLTATDTPVEERETARIEQDVRVKSLAAEVVNGSQRLVNLKEKLDPNAPSLIEWNKRVEEMKKLLADARVKARAELRLLPEPETRQALLSRIAEIDEKAVVMERVLQTRKRLRDELEKQLAARAVQSVDVTSQIDALKPKKELVARLQAKIASWEVEAALAQKLEPAMGVEAKLDVLIREVEALRKDVSELKKR